MDEPTRYRSSRWRAIGVGALCALALGALGGLATDIGPWYLDLKRPPWQPPDAWFAPVWTTIYALSAVSAAIAWRAMPGAQQRRGLALVWLANASFNLLWSVLFFRLQRPDWALAELSLLWLSIALLVLVSYRASRVAAALLLPYLGWVSFAAVLNDAVIRLNGPFGG